MPLRSSSQGKPPQLIIFEDDDGESAFPQSTRRAPTPPNTAATMTDPTKPKIRSRLSSTASPLSGREIVLLPSSPPSPSPSPSSQITQPTTTTKPKAPAVPKVLLPLVPPSPYPWLWRCHACYSVYRLSCTRRCLNCSHVFCSGPPSDTEKGDKNKQRRSGGPCRAEFDYMGWEALGTFRRIAAAAATITDQPQDHITDSSNSNSEEDEPLSLTHTMKKLRRNLVSVSDTLATWKVVSVTSPRGKKPPIKVWDQVSRRERALVLRQKEAMYIKGQHDCWLHCDYPSECRHAIYTACVEGRAKRDTTGKGYTAIQGSGGVRDKLGRIFICRQKQLQMIAEKAEEEDKNEDDDDDKAGFAMGLIKKATVISTTTAASAICEIRGGGDAARTAAAATDDYDLQHMVYELYAGGPGGPGLVVKGDESHLDDGVNDMFDFEAASAGASRYLAPPGHKRGTGINVGPIRKTKSETDIQVLKSGLGDSHSVSSSRFEDDDSDNGKKMTDVTANEPTFFF
ncbi:hypothetical protein B0H63DRAFT_471150 [Podospora didyma]|uniref:Uncharacterized protein n=1 Tax=Podospora didyma TaxID=330526 RepID=A0AAE0U1Z7_9PEZI|nr:hypothetical protein B0H63DRAFT_471150 [Podospora didyma]